MDRPIHRPSQIAFMLIRCYVPKKTRLQLFPKHTETNGNYFAHIRNTFGFTSLRYIATLKPYLKDIIDIKVINPFERFFEQRYIPTIRHDFNNDLSSWLSIPSNGTPIRYSLISNSLMETFIRKLSDDVPYIDYVVGKLNNFYYSHNYNRHYTIRSCGTITFTPKNKPTILNDRNSWARDNRQSTKLAKAFRKWFSQANIPNPYSDSEIELIHNKIMEDFIFTGTIEEVKGDKIKWAYYGDNYKDKSGTLNASCMKYDECQEYIEFYAQNNITLLLATDVNNLVIGRALVWHDVEFEQENGKSFRASLCDRVYGKPITTSKIIDFAKRHGYITKEHQNYNDTHLFEMPNGERISADIYFTFPSYTNALPYMDTFKTGRKCEHDDSQMIISNSHCYDFELTDTSGNYIEGSRQWSEYYDRYISQEDAIYSEYLSDYIIDAYAVWSNYHDSQLVIDDAVYSELDSDYYHVDESTNSYSNLQGDLDITTEDVVSGYVNGNFTSLCPTLERTVFVPQHGTNMYVSQTVRLEIEVTNIEGQTYTVTYNADADDPQNLTIEQLEKYESEICG